MNVARAVRRRAAAARMVRRGARAGDAGRVDGVRAQDRGDRGSDLDRAEGGLLPGLHGGSADRGQPSSGAREAVMASGTVTVRVARADALAVGLSLQALVATGRAAPGDTAGAYVRVGAELVAAGRTGGRS